VNGVKLNRIVLLRGRLELGDEVSWLTAQGGEKIGTVQESVPAGLFPHARIDRDVGRAWRDVSYVVKIGDRCFWPMASILTRSENGSTIRNAQIE